MATPPPIVLERLTGTHPRIIYTTASVSYGDNELVDPSVFEVPRSEHPYPSFPVGMNEPTRLSARSAPLPYRRPVVSRVNRAEEPCDGVLSFTLPVLDLQTENDELYAYRSWRRRQDRIGTLFSSYAPGEEHTYQNYYFFGNIGTANDPETLFIGPRISIPGSNMERTIALRLEASPDAGEGGRMSYEAGWHNHERPIGGGRFTLIQVTLENLNIAAGRRRFQLSGRMRVEEVPSVGSLFYLDTFRHAIPVNVSKFVNLENYLGVYQFSKITVSYTEDGFVDFTATQIGDMHPYEENSYDDTQYADAYR